MEPQELAAKAADYIEEHGHTKYSLEDRHGRVCISGAVILAGGGSSGRHILSDIPESFAPTMRMIRAYLGCDNVVNWNNAPERTQDEVVAVLREIAGQTVTVGDAHDQMLTG